MESLWGKLDEMGIEPYVSDIDVPAGSRARSVDVKKSF